MNARRIAVVVLAGGPALFAGCKSNGSKIDPWQDTNRVFYDFDNNLDKYVLKPMTDAYVKVVPKQVRECVTNGFDNLGYLNVILNDVLQGKWEQSGHDVARMAINSTVGIGGLFDLATPFGHVRHENDFGVTLGKWGYEPGPYLVLPLFGPSNVRDVWSLPVSMATNPMTYVDTPTWLAVSMGVVNAVDERSQYDSLVKFRDAAAIDSYVFTRDAYLAYRQNKINDGQGVRQPDDFYNDVDDGPTTRRSTTVPATRGE